MFVTVKRKKLVAGAVLIAVFALLTVGVGFTSAEDVYLGKVERQLPIYSVARDDKLIAISFDAAWGADKTKGIMDVCDAYGVEATFFLVGFWVDKFPELVTEICERGFAIGNHSTNHLHMAGLSETEIARELNVTSDKIEALTGKRPVYFRPPFGEYNDRLISVAGKNGYVPVQWSVDSLDWKGISASEITERILTKTKSGSIILCHNNSDHILDALPAVILGLKNKGFTFVTMDKLIYAGESTIDNNGVQHVG